MNVSGRLRGWIALSPLIVFIAVYLLSSLLAADFYAVPVASSFLIASIYAIIITPGKITERLNVFSGGAGNQNVLLMIWIFILAGAFASLAKAIGCVQATVDLALMILPGKLLYVGLFLAACFISMSIGTSVGTIVALVPIAAGMASEASLPLPLITAIIVGGAFFGDNLSFISDTTIAATRTQGCDMSDKFKTNFAIVLPAAIITAVIYVFLGRGVEIQTFHGKIEYLKILPYIAIIVMALSGMNVTVLLSIGIAMCAVIGFCTGLSWTEFLASTGSGIAGMGDLIIVTLLAGGMLELIRHNGGLDFIVGGLSKGVRGRRSAELSIASLAAISNFCTANNTIAIITTGSIAKEIAGKFGVPPRKVASLLDTFSCIVQCIIPYGAQMLMACSLAGVTALPVMKYLFYPLILLFCALGSIAVRYPRT